MTRLNLVKTLQLGNEENGFIRYEIFSKDAEHYDYPEKIIVYHEKELNNSGDKCWVKSSDKISLEHLGFQHNSGLQRTVAINMPPSRCLSSAIYECIKHYAEKQQKI